jgi:YVTN family beta-propeller protein
LDGKRFYVTSADAGNRVAIDVATGRVRGTLAVGGEPEGVAEHPRWGVDYFPSERGNPVTVADVKQLRLLSTIIVGQRPRDIDIAPDGTCAERRTRRSTS